MAKRKPVRVRNVVPDRLDLRDRPYLPAVREAPRAELNTFAEIRLGVRNQKDTNACTGFALAATIDILLSRAGRKKDASVSPFMLYSMARRYDEFPGYKADDGSSVRGALKAWYRHGACAASMWQTLKMPPPVSDPAKDWWQDAARRPLGAYYRVDSRSVTDLQVALNEVGVVYASVVCHGGWDVEARPKGKELWQIPQVKALESDGGHAIALVGYNRQGFLVLNSWGAEWGSGGLAVITYEDWLENAMDCWVAQIGVPTDQHLKVAQAVSLRTSGNRVTLASDLNLRNKELSPFIVNVENNGNLSGSGSFRTLPSDLTALATIHLDTAIKKWQLAPGQPVDIAIYAHGGLVGEESAADTAARWIPGLYDKQIFPVFIMWESGLWSTLKNRLADILAVAPTDVERRTAGIKDQFQRWVNERLERTFAKPGSFCWNEMKQNAEALSLNPDSGMRLLFEEFCAVRSKLKRPVRFHLIGHSAGAIVHTYMVRQMLAAKESIDSVVFMAPAVRNDLFVDLVRPHLGKKVSRFATFLLDEQAEAKDPTCRAMLGYGRSLLYLVSESFETDQRHMPILGMAQYLDAAKSGITPFVAPGPESQSTTHGGFDDDERTMASVIKFVKGQ